MSRKPGYSKNFGRAMMKELKTKAKALGIDFDFHLNSDDMYEIHHFESRTRYLAPSAVAACYFMFGLMAMVASPAGNLLSATWVVRPPIESLGTLNNGVVAPAQNFDDGVDTPKV